MHDLCWAANHNSYIKHTQTYIQSTHLHECSKTENMPGDKTQWSINDKSHSIPHPSFPFIYTCPLIEWMWLAAGGGRWERAGFGVRHSSPIRLILEWRGKQRFPRQQLAGDAGKGGGTNESILWFWHSTEVCVGHTHTHTHTHTMLNRYRIEMQTISDQCWDKCNLTHNVKRSDE